METFIETIFSRGKTTFDSKTGALGILQHKMRRLSALRHIGGSKRRSKANAISMSESKGPMAGVQDFTVGTDESTKDLSLELQSDFATNVILNHDFSDGINFWHPNLCEALLVSGGYDNHSELAGSSKQCYVVVTKRTQPWHGLEQDITARVTPGYNYVVTADVTIGGVVQGAQFVQGTLRLDFENSPTKYIFIGRVSVSNRQWEKINGSFSLASMPKQVVFYLEGPSPGVDLLINYVTIFTPREGKHQEQNAKILKEEDNLIYNSQFEDGLKNWSGRGCKILLHDSMDNGKILPVSGKAFASATERSQNWNGIQQEITGRVQRKLAYDVISVVRIFGSSSANVQATLWVQAPNGREQYIGIAKMQVSETQWVQLHGKFLLNASPSKAVIYLEGPPPGTDILLDSLVVKHAEKPPPSSPPDIENARGMMMVPEDAHAVNIILNHDFSEGFHYWHPTCCNGHVVSGMSSLVNGVTAYTGQNFAIILNRTESWQGLEQEITAKVSAGLTYTVSAWVRVYGSPEQPIEVQATLKLEFKNSPTRYLSVGRTLATTSQWVKLEGSFSIDKMAKKAIFYLEGPPPKVYLLVDSVTVSPCNRTWHENHVIGVNIIDNSSLHKGLTAWYPLGSCTLKICTGSPHLLPPAVKESLGQHKPLNGHYILTTNRTETWMGPAQTITGRLRLHLTYQVTAWVRVEGTNTPQVVNVALGVDNQWVNGGQIEADGDRWYELSGSFRIEKQPSKVTAYVQGPSPGVNLMVAELHIFPVDRKARFTHLKAQTDKVRKRDVILKISGSYPSHGTVKVRQTINSFPFGSCISRSNIDNEDFVDFFLKNFNWAVFGNELKWYHTEPQQGKLNYADADELLSFCKRHGIKTRGHCIFWEVIDVIQPWVQSLGVTDLMTAVENRLRGLLTRYEGQFKHYDVNNEMLHGTFYKDKLGSDIRAYMFKAANQLDPSAMLFVNDYHVEDGCDSKSCPEKYIHHILDLQKCGAPVGGIGIQGHIKNPVGPVICSALDKLAILNLPIWFTELDVSAENEHLRADDLEVVLREAYAHPAVEGIVLWGFWETFMCTENSHLVGAEGDVNEAGRRYIALREEWMSNADGVIDDHGQFEFRGFHGTYNVEIDTPSKKISKTIVVDKGDSPLLLAIEVE